MLIEIKHKIESLEIVDQSFQGLSADLSSNLAVKEFSEIQDRRNSGIRTPKIEYIEPVTPRRADMFASLKERLASFSKRDSGNQKSGDEMPVESSFGFDSFKKKEKKADPFNFLFARAQVTERSDDKAKNYQNSQKKPFEFGTQTALFNSVDSNSMEFDEVRDRYRGFEENPTHRRQKTDVNSYNRISDRKPLRFDVLQEEQEESHNPYDNGTEYTFRERPVIDVEEPRGSKSKSKSKDQASRGNTHKSKHPDSDDSGDERRRKHQESRQRYQKGQRARDFKVEVEDSSSESNAKEDSADTENSNSNSTPKKVEKVERVKGLHDWIIIED